MVMEIRSMKWAKIKGCSLYWRFGRISIFFYFQLLEATGTFLCSWLLPSSKPAVTGEICLMMPSLSCLHFPLVRTPTIGPTWIIQDHLPISRPLITSAKSFLPCKDLYPQILGIKAWTSWGPLFCQITFQMDNKEATI